MCAFADRPGTRPAHRHQPGGDPPNPLAAADAIGARILAEGPDTVAAVIFEPVQNSGGCLVPPAGYFQRVRDTCDRLRVPPDHRRHDLRVGAARTVVRHRVDRRATGPDHHREGLTPAYVPMGAVLTSSRAVEPLIDAGSASRTPDLRRPSGRVAVALANLDDLADEQLLEHVSQHRAVAAGAARGATGHPGGRRLWAGFFLSMELVADQATQARLDPRLASLVVGKTLGPELRARRLVCRAADRGYPVIQLAPPPVAGPAELDEMIAIMRAALEAAADHVARA